MRHGALCRYAEFDATPSGVDVMAKSIAAFNHRATPSPEDEDAAKRSPAVELSGTAGALLGALKECQRVAVGGARRATPALHRLPVTVADDGFFVDANGADVFPAGFVLRFVLFAVTFLDVITCQLLTGAHCNTTPPTPNYTAGTHTTNGSHHSCSLSS